MRIRIGVINVANSGTPVPLTDADDIDDNMSLVWLHVRGMAHNTGSAYIGQLGMTVDDGWELPKADTVGLILPIREIDGKGSINPGQVCFDADNNDDHAHYVAIFE